MQTVASPARSQTNTLLAQPVAIPAQPVAKPDRG
jgi:hypothetical protein